MSEQVIEHTTSNVLKGAGRSNGKVDGDIIRDGEDIVCQFFVIKVKHTNTHACAFLISIALSHAGRRT